MRKDRINGVGIVLLVILTGAVTLAVSTAQSGASGAAAAAVASPPITPPASPASYPPRQTQVPQGVPAIRPTLPGKIPAFTVDDVKQFVSTHPMPGNLATVSQATIVQIVFLPSKEVSALLGGEDAGRPAGATLCYVELQGTFVFSGPLSREQPAGGTVTFQRGFEVFDASTGNLLLHGGLVSK